jgi:hypothetical protein
MWALLEESFFKQFSFRAHDDDDDDDDDDEEGICDYELLFIS